MTLAGSLIETARIRAGMSQAALARRAGTSQSAIALYEGGKRDPGIVTLQRILAAAGFELRVRLEPVDDHDEVLARWFRTLSDDVREQFGAEQLARGKSA